MPPRSLLMPALSFRQYARTCERCPDYVYLNINSRILAGTTLLKAIYDLPDDQRKAVVLRRILGQTEDEVAAIFGVDGRTIRNRVQRAEARLKNI